MLKIVDADQLSFNYDAVPAPVAVQAREAAQRIRLRLRRSAEDIIEIGRDLLAVKERIGHGNFLPWIEAEFGMSRMTANKFMQVASVYGANVNQVYNLDPSALYELAAPKTPQEVREEVERMIEAGEVVTKATVQQLKAEVQLKDESIAALVDRNAELAVKLSAPVQPAIDEDAIREAARAEAEADLRKRINELSNQNVSASEELKRVKAELEAVKAKSVMASQSTDASNVVRPSFGIAADDLDEYADEDKAISAFSGALGTMEGLEFSASAFWEKAKRGTHGKRLHQALLSVNATIGLLIKEYAK